MRVSILFQVTLKDRPSGYRGLYSEDYIVGRQEVVSFSNMAYFVVRKLLDWYCQCNIASVLNEELDALCDRLRNLYLEEVMDDSH